MGYWNEHPMAGDDPLDWKGVLVEETFDQDPSVNWWAMSDEQAGQLLASKLPELYTATLLVLPQEHWFVLPFLLAEYHVMVPDPELSAKIKALIGDGGSEQRGYLRTDDEAPAAPENHYNGFRRPEDYAAQLRDLWDELMAGTRLFGDLCGSRDLLSVVADSYDEDDPPPGLLNIQ